MEVKYECDGFNIESYDYFYNLKNLLEFDID